MWCIADNGRSWQDSGTGHSAAGSAVKECRDELATTWRHSCIMFRAMEPSGSNKRNAYCKSLPGGAESGLKPQNLLDS